jgi:hypothetical protein
MKSKCPKHWWPTCCCSPDGLEPSEKCWIHGVPDLRFCPYCNKFRYNNPCTSCGCTYGISKDNNDVGFLSAMERPLPGIAVNHRRLNFSSVGTSKIPVTQIVDKDKKIYFVYIWLVAGLFCFVPGLFNLGNLAELFCTIAGCFLLTALSYYFLCYLKS